MASNLPPGCRESDIPGNRPEDEAYERMLDSFFQQTHFTDTEKKIIDDEPVVCVVIKAIEYGIMVGTKQEAACEAEASFYMFNSLRQQINEVIDKVERKVTGHDW